MKKILLCGVLASALFTACSKEGKLKTLRYEMSCNNCFVVYYGQNEEQFSEFDQEGNWSKELTVEPGFVALIVAKNMDSQPAQVTARIKVDGEIVKENTSHCPINGTVLVTDTIQ
ncbi:MAG: hypothetical protein MH137_09440 [Flavobacteriales bacterium]|nr:hypothetical protein [Flavobacteriales bacterium]